MSDTQFHPALLGAVKRHQEFFEGTRSCLIKVHAYINESLEEDTRVKAAWRALQTKFVPGVPYEGLDWNRD